MNAGVSPETQSRPSVSVICTVRNEAASIGQLLAGLLTGTRPPDEVVIADAGSTDGTREILGSHAAADGRVRVLDVAGNRSRGRNAAIAAARGPVIACIDGGCVPEPEWLQRLVAPFASGAQWVGGFYRPRGKTRAVCIGLTMVFVLEEALTPGFIPSARSMAFTKQVWERVGGFPEQLEVSEDTAFDEALAAAGVPMVFAPDAVVGWTPPRTLHTQSRVLFAWSRSDGRAGIRTWGYKRSIQLLALSALAVVALAVWDLRLAPLGLVPLAALMVRQTRHKYRWARGFTKYYWIPVAWAVGLVARSVGFLVGWGERRRSA
ncbi:MAG TPA: glycosyltransferase [Acidimicrobiia bacterium]|nr:glycosyltransferase [Acidimicrobiia bacterium]